MAVVAALETQRQLRDLAGLDRSVDSVEWCTSSDAGSVPVPLVLCGLLATEDPDTFKALTRDRADVGLGTLIVPRFRPCDLGALMGAPGPVEVVPAEFRSCEMDGRTYRVPGSLVFRTNLPSGRWSGLPGSGTILLAYHPTIARGCTILCSAAIAGRRPDGNLEDQRALMELLVSRLVTAGAGARGEGEGAHVGTLSPAELLVAYPDAGPSVLLALLQTLPARDLESVAQAAGASLGVRLDRETMAGVLARLSQGVTRADLEKALVQAGWGAFLRRLAITRSSEGA